MRKSKNSIDKGVPKFSKQNIKNWGVWKVIESTRKDEFVNEEEISTANKKYKAIFKYCLNDDHNKPVYPEKIFSYDNHKIEDKKEILRR